MPDVSTLRDSLRAARAELFGQYGAHSRPANLLHAHARLVDRHLKKLWQDSAIPSGATLAATGGYGRGELYPMSDIDLLILLEQDPDEALQQRLHTLVQTLWDTGLEAGHSVRTVAQCLTESADITVQTNLLEARCLAGSQALFDTMTSALTQHLDRRAFYQAKVAEQEKRHLRFLDTDYNLEPNLKESPGGLRDLQNVLWISRAAGFGGSWKELAAAGMITPQETTAVARHEALLQTLRIRLHLLANRREDRLMFEYQTDLARQMGIAATATRRASEHMMQQYYRTKHAVQQLNAVLLQNMGARLFPESGEIQPVNARFIARGKLLEMRDPALFEREPSTILECFLLLETHPQLTDFSAATLRVLWGAHRLIDARFRKDAHNRELFMSILRQPQGLTHTLRRMNQLGILGAYLPAFGRIVGQMQHDLFHVYTVDQHILMVVRNLRRFTLSQYAHENPLCSHLIREFARPEVLYIAGLFHDIAKGRGGDHSQLGRADAARFCKQHGMSREDSALVVWLVENHLGMSATAQKQDLSDQDVIAAFADKVQNDRHLVALYLLTVADIRGTSPKVWNAWKAKLLEDLFRYARSYMAGGKIADQAGEIRRLAAEQLALYAVAREDYALFWAQLDTEYFLHHEPHEIAWHTRLLAYRANSTVPVVKARLARIGEGLQVMVYCPDKPHLFGSICSFFEQLNYNIVDAKIHTTQHGYALDSFLVMAVGAAHSEYRDVMGYIEHELAQKLASSKAAPAPQGGRITRQLKHFPIAPEVTLDAENKGRYRLSIVAGDRPGLLARIAHVLTRHHIELHSAKVNTLGARVEDTFRVSGVGLNEPERADALCGELRRQLA